MKIGSISFNVKGLAALMLVLFSYVGYSQTDTLHLYYHHTQIAPPDSIQAKIENWAKGLTGKHVDIQVVAYYHKPEFKKFSQQRLDELFLTLNRKARSVISIESMVTKKGEDYQRTMVDIIYKPTLSAEEAAAAKAKTEAEAAKKKEAEKSAKDSEKKTKEADKKSKSEVAAEQTVKGDDKQVKKEKKEPAAAKSKEKKTKPAVVYGNPGTKPAGKGVYTTLAEVAEIKAARIIVPKTDSPEIDSLLTECVKRFWTMNKNVEYGTMGYNEAKKLAKTDKSILIFIVTDVRSSSLRHYNANTQYQNNNQVGIGNTDSNWGPRRISEGTSVMLEDGKGKIALAGYFPGYSEDGLVAAEALAFGVSQMNSLLYNLEKYNTKNNMTFNKPFKQNAPRLKDKTLLIPDLWLSEKVDPRDIPAVYEGKAKVVSYEEWADAILGKKDYAYTMIVPYPSGGKFIYLHYLMDAATGDVLFISQPRLAADVHGINVSAANSGWIKEKNLKYYNDAFHMKQNDDESEEKAVESETETKKDETKEVKEVPEKQKKEDKKKKKD